MEMGKTSRTKIRELEKSIHKRSDNRIPKLQYNKPLYLNTDTSNVAIGKELFQMDSNEKRATLGYASRTLKTLERRYTTTEIEALALLYCCTKFKQH